MSKNLILDKLEGVKTRFEEVAQLITEPDVIADMKRYIKLNKEYKSLEPIITSYKNYTNVLDNIQSSKEMLGTEKDEEMREMAKIELDELAEQKLKLEEEIKFLLIPADPEDDSIVGKYASKDCFKRICINRHHGKINAVFLDFSIRNVGLKKLWDLNWYRGYENCGCWSGPDVKWPGWMWHY